MYVRMSTYTSSLTEYHEVAVYVASLAGFFILLLLRYVITLATSYFTMRAMGSWAGPRPTGNVGPARSLCQAHGSELQGGRS